MNLITTFNVRLAHIQSLGYAKCVQFSLPTPQPKPPAGVPVISVDKERSAGSAIHKQRARMQLLRTNRLESTPQRVARRAKDMARYQRKLERRAEYRREQAAMRLWGES
jgi:hypothetical protein